MRIGVFGGSFDPPHPAHLQVAKAARDQLGLDKVIWLPAFLPPHKSAPSTSFQHRLGMTRALIAGEPRTEISEVESSLPTPSYTLHSLRALKNHYGTGHSWHLIIGADNWAIFPGWHQPEALLAECRVAVYPRRGTPLTALPPGITLLDCPEIPQESRVFREEMGKHPEKALGELPAGVADYIREHGLYGLPQEARP